MSRKKQKTQDPHGPKKDDFEETKDINLPKVLGDSFLYKITPNRNIKLNEDTVIFDGSSVGTIVYIYDTFGKTQKLNSQWGIRFIENLVTDNSKKAKSKVQVAFLSTIETMTSEWVNDHQDIADGNVDDVTKRRSVFKNKMRDNDLNTIATQLESGDMYHAVGLKYVITASSLDTLDAYLEDLEYSLRRKFPGIILTLGSKNIKNDYYTLFNSPMDMPGSGLMMTSTMLAGFYNLVTRGIDDPTGVYVGEQIGDINNTAVIWDMTAFQKRSVIAASNNFGRIRDFNKGYLPDEFSNLNGAQMWVNTLITQLARRKQGRVFTIALAPMNLSPTVESFTKKLDMNSGAINMAEMFGDKIHSREIYASNIEKWKVMTKQLSEDAYNIGNVQAVDDQISNQTLAILTDVLQDFYIEHNMWTRDPIANPEKVRVVDRLHNEVPDLSMFVSYLKTAIQEENSKRAPDQHKLRHLNNLTSLYATLLTTNGDLFNVKTTSKLDTIGVARHAMFDFSRLHKRGSNVVLTQLINSIDAIASQSQSGDVIIIHGAEQIKSITQQYIQNVLDFATDRNVRLVFSYTSVEKMIKDHEFNKMTTCDYVLTGTMDHEEIKEYNKVLGGIHHMTDAIQVSINQTNDPRRYYLRRLFENVVFDANPTI